MCPKHCRSSEKVGILGGYGKVASMPLENVLGGLFSTAVSPRFKKV